jgi:hypothetical protein
MRSEATIERARLTRSDVPLRLPRVVLRQGAPPASARH